MDSPLLLRIPVKQVFINQRSGFFGLLKRGRGGSMIKLYIYIYIYIYIFKVANNSL